jgi:hypothetical protein
VPSYNSQQVGFSQFFANELLTAITTRPAAALVAAGKVRLSQDPAFNPTPQSTMAALATNEANFSGYTAGGDAATIGTPVNLSPNCQGVLATAMFVAAPAGPFVPNTVYGYWVDDGTNVVAYERFANGASFSFASPGDFLDLTVLLPVQLTQATA